MPVTAKTKKEKIRYLLERGDYSSQEISKMVDTSLDNVYKETSLFRKHGGRIVIEKSRRTGVTTSPSGRREMSKIDKVRVEVESNDHVAAPPLTTEDLKMLYGDLQSGQRTAEIVAKRGFHPEAVEIEERRYLRLSNQDRRDLLDRIFEIIEPFNSDLVATTIEKYMKTGFLDNTDIIAVIIRSKNELIQQGRDGVLTAISNVAVRIPDGFMRPKCWSCGTLIPDAIVRQGSLAEMQISRSFSCPAHMPY